MSILPEETPVAFMKFMALGSWRLMKMGILMKQMKTVKTLGSATGQFKSRHFCYSKLFNYMILNVSGREKEFRTMKVCLGQE